jgi:hypothetical protein
MKSVVYLLFLFAFNYCFSQNLISSKLLPCNNYWEDIFRERIAVQKFSGDTLYLEVNLKANCSADLKPVFKSISDSLFIDLKDISEIHTACNCCYSMLFTIANIRNNSFKLFLNNQEFTYSKSKYLAVPPRNIPKELLKNEFTADGLKIGYWKTKVDKGNYYIEYYGNKPSKNQYPLWIKSFNKNGEVTSIIVTEVKDEYLIDVNLRMYEEILREQEKDTL